MILLSKRDITLDQVDDMLHCIGFEWSKVKYRKYRAYRNYYTTPDNKPSLDMLGSLGLMSKRDFPRGGGDNPKLYYVTEKGFEVLGKLLNVRIIESD